MPDEGITEIKRKLQEYDKRISKLESLFQTKPETIRKEVSIKEFILSRKPKNAVQKTLAIGYYLERHGGLSSFNIRDLEKSFRTAREKIPQNVGDKVQKSIETGHMMEAKGKKDNLKAWVLTDSGETYVENDFKKER